MNSIYLSIITITKNPNMNWFKQCLNSVATQKFNSYEHIILDASDDCVYQSILALLDEFKYSHVKLVRQKTKGIWLAFEEAYSLSLGEFVGVINSDDYYLDVNLFRNVKDSIEQKGLDYIYGDSIRVNAFGGELYRHSPLPFLRVWNYDFFVFNISHHTMFLRKSVFFEIPFLKEGVDAVDLDFMRRLYKSDYKGFYSGWKVAAFRIHNDNFSASYSKEGAMDLFSKWTGLPRVLYYLSKVIIFVFNFKYFKFILNRYMLNIKR